MMKDYLAVIVPAAAVIITALLTNFYASRNRRSVDVTSVAQAGLAVVPEMGDKVLEALEQVRELTDQVRNLTESLTAAEAQVAHLGRELDGATKTAVALRAENDALRSLINERGV